MQFVVVVKKARAVATIASAPLLLHQTMSRSYVRETFAYEHRREQAEIGLYHRTRRSTARTPLDRVHPNRFGL